jgi:AcrR family transcriptional regulator
MSSRPKKSAGPQHESTKERIRQVATQEFSAEGFAGARVDRIAKAAGVNIRMIYYFFGSKEGLLKDVMSGNARRRSAAMPKEYDDAGDLLSAYFDGFYQWPNAARLLVWEALQTPAESADLLSDYDERRDTIKQRVDKVRALQKKGLIPADMDPKLFYLFAVALAIFPPTFSQTVYVVTGKYPSNKAFRKQYNAFLKRIADLIAKDAGGAPAGG